MASKHNVRAQSTVDLPHTQSGVGKMDTSIIPSKVFFVFTIYEQTPNKMYHKKMNSFEEALEYVNQYKDTVAGTMVIKEYWDRDMLLVVGNAAPNSNRNKKRKRTHTR